MAVDPERGKKIKELLSRTRSMLPKLADDALETGDFSAVDQAKDTIERLSGIGDKFMSEVEAGQGQQISTLEQPPQQETPDEIPQLGTPEKAPTQEASPVGAPPGQPQSLKSTLSGLGFGAKAGQEPVEPLPKPPMTRPGASLTLGGPAKEMTPAEMPKKPVPAERFVIPEEEPEPIAAQPRLTGAASQEEAPDYVPSAVEKGSSEPVAASEAAPPSPEVPDVSSAIPAAEKDFQGDSAAVLEDIGQYVEKGNPAEREFYERVRRELGPRPKQFTIAKLLTALAVGAGSIVGAWFTRRYNGQALIDQDQDVRDYDARLAQIAGQTYAANKGQDKYAQRDQAAQSRLAYLQNRLDDRLGKKGEQDKDLEGVKQGGRVELLDTKGTQAKEQLNTREGGLNTRQDKGIASREKIAREKMQARLKDESRWSDKDKQDAAWIKSRVSGLEKGLLYSDDPEGDKRKIQEYMNAYAEISGRYQQTPDLPVPPEE